MIRKNLFLAALLLFTVQILSSYETDSLSLHIEITELQEAREPFIIDNHIIFSYSAGDRYIRRVAAAFGSDNFKKVFPFMKNEYNVFFLIREIPAAAEYIDYRLIIDGVWTDDPKNSAGFRTAENVKVSRITIPLEYREKKDLPRITGNGKVEFIYNDTSSKNVYLAGDFNGWDPFMFKMKEDPASPGTYKISLRMAPGKYYYSFISNGVMKEDLNNPKRAYDSRGNTVSYIEIN